AYDNERTHFGIRFPLNCGVVMSQRQFFQFGGVLLTVVLPGMLRAEPEPGYDGKSLSAWIRQIDHTKATERKQARAALVAIVNWAPANVGQIVEALSNPDSDDAEQRIESLIELGPSAVPALTAAVFDENPRRQMTAVYVLRKLGGRARSASPALIHVLNDKE